MSLKAGVMLVKAQEMMQWFCLARLSYQGACNSDVLTFDQARRQRASNLRAMTKRIVMYDRFVAGS